MLLSLAAMGIMGSWGPFWSLLPAFLSGTAAASGIALINSVGNLGGFFGPTIVGYVRNATQSFEDGLIALAAIVLLGGGLMLALRQAPAAKRVPEVVGG